MKPSMYISSCVHGLYPWTLICLIVWGLRLHMLIIYILTMCDKNSGKGQTHQIESKISITSNLANVGPIALKNSRILSTRYTQIVTFEKITHHKWK